MSFDKLTQEEQEKRLSSLKFIVVNPERVEKKQVLKDFEKQFGQKELSNQLRKIIKDNKDGKLNMFKLTDNYKKPKNMGGLLQDDNEKYGMKEGGPGIEALRKEAPEVVERMGYEHGGFHTDTRTEDERQMDYLESAYERAIETGQKEDAQNVADQIDRLQTKMIEEKAEIDDRMRKAIGGSLLADDMPIEEPVMKEPMVEEPMMDEPMMDEPEEDMMPEEEMLPDDEMEDEYLDFILDEALDNDEEEYLMSQLQDNDRLSEIFDKVIDVAQEFAGSGPVEGPGSGVSDSIPARLSDGEFVFTAKAVEEIGADNLMAMMKDAEMKADERQGLAEGGEPEEEETVVMPVEQPASQQDIRVTKTTVGAQASQQEVNDLVDEEVKKSMLRGSRNLG
jgi:hypothetical protein